ncbi:hypothetical protein AVM11_08950 [Sphingomonas melonis TY]|uniref:Uncharacterized protein n=2 Tax=Sphingomonas melonis TaxID=152682 RepID=A0A175Y0Z0_9SPHN|nr:hypothetical protein BJP26_00425 [Sphingomonas melonis TY]KZB94119.1 hypothetical protein AVM11_08950 [Sphingomonas melonis TY]
MWQAAYDGAAAVLADPLPADVRRLVIAAREVTDCGTDEDETRELLDAVEAFSSRVPYEDQPDDMADASVPDRLARRMGAEFVARDAAPRVEGLTSGEGIGALLDQFQKAVRDAEFRRPRGPRSGDHAYYATLRENADELKRQIIAAASPKATATASVRECSASPDHADIMDTMENAADDWQAKGYASALAEVRDMANVGRALMEALPEGYHYMNCPSEIVSDLQNQLSDIKTFGLTDSGTAATIGGERA